MNMDNGMPIILGGLALLVGGKMVADNLPKKARGSAFKGLPKKGKKAKKAKKSGGAAGAYAMFVKAQMPALLEQGYSSPQAMKKIGELWRAR